MAIFSATLMRETKSFFGVYFLGGCCRLQQSGGGAGGDYVLVGRVGQVDGLHSHLWRRCDDTGETLPQAEVSPRKQTRKDKSK